MMTKIKPEINVDIKQTGLKSAAVHAPFDEALESLISEGYEVISLAQNSQLRIQQGADSYISRQGNWTREGILYIPNEKPKLMRNSPVLLSSRKATHVPKKVKEFYPTRAQIEQALEDSVDFPQKNTEIPTDRFDSDALTVYTFGGEDEARVYGEFLRKAGIKKMLVWPIDKNYINKQNQPFVRQVWFWNLGYDGPNLYDLGSLHEAGWLRGVKEK